MFYLLFLLKCSVEEGPAKIYDFTTNSIAEHVTYKIIRIIEKEEDIYYNNLLRSTLDRAGRTRFFQAELSNAEEKKTFTILMVEWDQNTKSTKNQTAKVMDRLKTIKSKIIQVKIAKLLGKVLKPMKILKIK